MNIVLGILLAAKVITGDTALDLALEIWGPQARIWTMAAPGPNPEHPADHPVMTYCVGTVEMQPEFTSTPFGLLPNPRAGEMMPPMMKGCGPNWVAAFMKAIHGPLPPDISPATLKKK